MFEIIKQWVIARLREKSTQLAIAIEVVALFGLRQDMIDVTYVLVVSIISFFLAVIDGEKLPKLPSLKGGDRLQAHWVVNLLAIGLLAFMLSACAGAVPWNPQGYSGITHITVKTGQACQIVETSVAVKGDCTVKIIDGKESGSIDVKTVQADGTTLNIKASDVKAFEGQAQRAGVEKGAIDAATKLTEKAIDAAASIKKVPIVKPDKKDNSEEQDE